MQESIEGWSGVGIKANHLLDEVLLPIVRQGSDS
jgi:hypothetical protein